MRRLLLLLALPACGSGSRDGFTPDADGGADAAGSGTNVFADGGADGSVAPDGPCDDGLTAYGDAPAFARAIGICKGLVSATFVQGTDGQHGVLPSFGKKIAPLEGKNLGVLSTGWARAYDSIDPASTASFKSGVQMGNGLPVAGAVPAGYPKSASGCAVSDQIFDPMRLSLVLTVPADARGFALDFDFFSGEWPDYVCTKYNDGFLVLVNDQPITFLGVNDAFFDRCTAATQTGCRGDPPIFATSKCGGDLGELEETGFYATDLYCNGQLSTGGGATGWLTTQAPAQPGAQLRVDLLIWDSGDARFDSSVLMDHFRWVTNDIAPSTTRLR